MKKAKLIRRAWDVFRKVKKESEKEVKIAIYSHHSEVAQLLKELMGGKENPCILVEEMENLNASRSFDLKILFLIGDKEEVKNLKKKIDTVKRERYLVAVVKGGKDTLLRLKEEKVPLHLVHILSSSQDYVEFLKAAVEKIPRGKIVSVGKKLPPLRDFVAERIIREVALENGWLATIGILPGADYPFLTLNQIRMALELATIYEREINKSRLKEILSVAGGGLVARSLAREALSLVPFAGWLAKGGISYAGTLAMGKLLKEYFRRGKWQ